jgi:hypothetical protein
MNILSARRCTVCSVVLLNGRGKAKYCHTHKVVMAEYVKTLRLIRSPAFKSLPWEYKRMLLWVINNPNHRDALP